MNSGMLVGALAIFTIGAALFLAINHFRKFSKNPKNRAQIDNVMAGGEAASTVAARSDPAVPDVPLKTRLDRSIASAHPDHPVQAEQQGQRKAKLDSEKSADRETV